MGRGGGQTTKIFSGIVSGAAALAAALFRLEYYKHVHLYATHMPTLHTCFSITHVFITLVVSEPHQPRSSELESSLLSEVYGEKKLPAIMIRQISLAVLCIKSKE